MQRTDVVLPGRAQVELAGACCCFAERGGSWYDPWQHAEQLGIPVVYRTDFRSAETNGCYDDEYRAIFMRTGLTHTVERCTLAHEIVHAEHRDIGHLQIQEDRADRIAAERLISLREIRDAQELNPDLGAIAIDLDVTEHMMNVFIRNYAYTH